MPSTELAFINQSTIWPDSHAVIVMQALQIQVDRDFEPAWGLDCNLHFYSASSSPPPADMQWLVLLDTTDQAGALGYHEMTPANEPIGKCFLKTTLSDGGFLSVTISHELLEMLADPWIGDCVLNGAQTKLYAREVCDACEDDQFSYIIGTGANAVRVSDFVLPSWFIDTPAIGPFDHGNHITQPFQLLSGGYIGYMNVTGGGWQQQTDAKFIKPHGTRRLRRQMPKSLWRPSTAPHS